jgi:hypothetical protein
MTSSPSPRSKWPWWVRAVLWKTSRRSTARRCVWYALAFAVVFAVVAMWILPAAVGSALLFLAAILYDRATVWVDKNAMWD